MRKTKRLKIFTEICIGLIFQIFITLIFGFLAYHKGFHENNTTPHLLPIIVGVGLSLMVWKRVTDVIKFISRNKNHG